MLKVLAGCILLTMTWMSHGAINPAPCHKNSITTLDCKTYIHQYTWERLTVTGQQIHTKQSRLSDLTNKADSAQKEHIVFACHKAVSVDNLVNKIQGRLIKNKWNTEEVKHNIDFILDQYLVCKQGHFGQPTTRY